MNLSTYIIYLYLIRVPYVVIEPLPHKNHTSRGSESGYASTAVS
jgi:hypothetical protein